MAYTQKFYEFVPSTPSAWEVIDLSGQGVPANAICEVVCANYENNADNTMGVRTYGSSLDRYLSQHESEGSPSSVNAFRMHVVADGSSRIEAYTTDVGFTKFYLVDYWDSGTYVEVAPTQHSIGTGEGWFDETFSEVAGSSIVEVVCFAISSGAETYGGVRENGSSLERKFLLHECEPNAYSGTNLTLFVGVDATKVAEIYKPSGIAFYYYTVGYWSDPPGTWTEKYYEIPANAEAGVWEDEDLSGQITDGAVVELAGGNDANAAYFDVGMRQNDSGDARYLPIDESEGGGNNLWSCHVKSDANGVVELYSGDLTNGHHYLTGQWELAGGETFYQTLDAATLPTMAVVKSTAKPLSCSSVPAGAVLKQTAKGLAAFSACLAGLLRKGFSKLISSTIGLAGLSASKWASQILDAVTTGLAGLSRVPSKLLSATTAVLASLSKIPTKVLSVASTGIATLTKFPAKLLTAVTAPSAGVAVLVKKLFAATTVGLAALVKRSYEDLIGTSVALAELTKKGFVSLASTTVPTMLLDCVKLALQQLDAATVALAGLAKKPVKILIAATVGLAGIAKYTFKTFAATSTVLVELVRQGYRTLVATTVGLADLEAVKIAYKVLNAVSTGAAGMVRMTVKAFAVATTGVAALVRLPQKILSSTTVAFAGLGRQVSKVLTATSAGLAGLGRKTMRFLVAVTVPMASVVKAATRTLVATGVGSGILNAAQVTGQVFYQTLVTASVATVTVTKAIRKSLSSVLTSLASIVRRTPIASWSAKLVTQRGSRRRRYR